MAMTVRNNAAAMYALNQLGRNDSELAKQLKKVSSGLRINGAGDDASGYAISVRLRSLEGAYGQDIANAQTGANLVAVAEGGIQSVVDNLRTMKEMMLNARNDTNTDADRAMIQKELDKRLETITDIAAETDYNGRLLLNGDYSETRSAYQTPIMGTRTVHVGPPGYTVVPGTGGSGSVLVQQNTVSNLAGGFTAASDTCSQTSNIRSDTNIECNIGFRYQYNGTVGFEDEYGALSTNRYAVQMNFQGRVDANGNSVTMIGGMDKQGFSILCDGGCRQYVNIKFDASINNAASKYDISTGDRKFEYVIGIKDIASKGVDELPKWIYEGIRYISNRGGTDTSQATNGTDTVFVDSSHNLRIHKKIDAGIENYYLARNGISSLCLYDEGTYVSTVMPGDDENITPGSHSVDTGQDITVTEIIGYINHEGELGNPLIIHTGAKQNQYIPVFINSMHPIALGINGVRVDDDRILDKTEPLGDPSVNKFAKLLKQVDDAIDYTLNEIVRMGAYRQRLSMTEDNLTTAQENTVSAKSTIADADMAKEMTGYTKANVLAQTAQSMVAQANQNLGGVLDLLQ